MPTTDNSALTSPERDGTTVDLATHRAESTLDDLDLGDEPSADAAAKVRIFRRLTPAA